MRRQNQKGQGLKLLTQQMLSRLPISLAQLKAGNNSQERKIRKKIIVLSCCIPCIDKKS